MVKHTLKLLQNKYVYPFFNIMPDRVKKKVNLSSEAATGGVVFY